MLYAVSADLIVVFCADPLTPGRVDTYFAGQAQVVRDLGGTVALIDHDALLAGDIVTAVRRVPRDLGAVWYRGWMIPSDRYAELDVALTGRGAHLRVGADGYLRAHELPGWYDTFTTLTPRSVWTAWRPGIAPDADRVAELVAPLCDGAAVVKDFVKSRKHEWDKACFIPDLTDIAATTEVIARMVDLQGEDLNGGVVVREFERYRQADGRTVEARVWWLDGVPIAIGAHPDTPGHVPEPDLSTVAPAVQRLGCRFVTTDMAQRDDGVWRVVEVGDGQVSDLPADLDPAAILRGLAAGGPG